MPWINLTMRRGALTKEMQHAVMAKLTDALMFWEKIPDTAEARKKMKGWIYEVADAADYNGGSPSHQDPFYFIEVRLPAGRFDILTKRHMILDFTKIVCWPKANRWFPRRRIGFGSRLSSLKKTIGASAAIQTGCEITKVRSIPWDLN